MVEKTNLGLAEHCHAKLGTHYLYGAKGQKVTRNEIMMWAKSYPKYYPQTRIIKALKWVGENATDCSGLISWYTGKLRSSSSYMAYAPESGPIDEIPEIMGLLVWYSGHIGVYIGGGQVIEARGFDYGVVKTDINDRPWTKWLKCPDIEYTEYAPTAPITPESSKAEIRWLQWKLNCNGAHLVMDGVYGPKTAQAVLDFWIMKGWKIGKKKGYCAGMNTIKALAR